MTYPTKRGLMAHNNFKLCKPGEPRSHISKNSATYKIIQRKKQLQYMKNNVQQVKVDNVQIEATASFVYLGNKITADYNEEELINMRFTQDMKN